MCSLQLVRLIGLLALVAASSTGCTPALWPFGTESTRSSAPVILAGVEQLESPAIGPKGNTFKPALMVDIDAASPAAGRTAGFYVRVIVGDPQRMRMRLVDEESRQRFELVRIAAPASEEERTLAAGPGPFNPTVRDLLGQGSGLFWLDQENRPGLECRFAVLIPQRLLSPFTRLDMFAAVAEDGSALGVAVLHLVRGFFYMAIIGDSVMWGNGLEERDKISALAAAVIERETRRRVVQQRYAQSEASILPAPGDSVCRVGCNGEAPTASTSISVQAELIQRPELVDLILMDGCINDVTVATILDPDTSEEELAALTQRFCGEEMATLLRKVRGLAPQARIVVTGYYQIVGPASDLFALQTWGRTQGEEPDPQNVALVAKLAGQSLLFRDAAHQSLQAAIAAVNAEAGGEAQVAFADPAFGPQNAVFAPDKWLWSMTADGGSLFETLNPGLELFPEDPLRRMRLAACLQPYVTTSTLQCVYASVGHPNPTGARAYADAVLRGLRSLGVLPPMPNTE